MPYSDFTFYKLETYYKVLMHTLNPSYSRKSLEATCRQLSWLSIEGEESLRGIMQDLLDFTQALVGAIPFGRDNTYSLLTLAASIQSSDRKINQIMEAFWRNAFHDALRAPTRAYFDLHSLITPIPQERAWDLMVSKVIPTWPVLSFKPMMIRQLTVQDWAWLTPSNKIPIHEVSYAFDVANDPTCQPLLKAKIYKSIVATLLQHPNQNINTNILVELRRDDGAQAYLQEQLTRIQANYADLAASYLRHGFSYEIYTALKSGANYFLQISKRLNTLSRQRVSLPQNSTQLNAWIFLMALRQRDDNKDVIEGCLDAIYPLDRFQEDTYGRMHHANKAKTSLLLEAFLYTKNPDLFNVLIDQEKAYHLHLPECMRYEHILRLVGSLSSAQWEELTSKVDIELSEVITDVEQLQDVFKTIDSDISDDTWGIVLPVAVNLISDFHELSEIVAFLSSTQLQTLLNAIQLGSLIKNGCQLGVVLQERDREACSLMLTTLQPHLRAILPTQDELGDALEYLSPEQQTSLLQHLQISAPGNSVSSHSMFGQGDPDFDVEQGLLGQPPVLSRFSEQCA